MAESKSKKSTTKKSSSVKSSEKGKAMNSKTFGKFTFLAGVVLAIVIALWPDPSQWAFWLLIVLGLVGGYTRISKASESHFILLTIGLHFFGGILGDFPTLGSFFVGIFDGLSQFLGAAVVAVVVRNVFGWFRK